MPDTLAGEHVEHRYLLHWAVLSIGGSSTSRLRAVNEHGGYFV